MDLASIAEDLRILMYGYGLKVLGGIAVLVVGRFVAGWLRGLTRRGLGRAGFDPTLVPFLSNLVFTGLLVLVLLSAAGVVGINTTSFIAVLGAAGLAVALAFQSTLSNFSAGVLLLTLRPFRVGDTVEVGGVTGTVREIGIFLSTLATPDNVRVTVPNSSISGAIIKNFSAHDTRRIDLVVGVSYDDDLNVAVRTVQDILKADARVLDEPAAVVAVHEMADSSVNLVVRPWVKTTDFWPTRWDLTKTIKERLEAAGCSIPYPQRDVHLYRVDASNAA